ncbi:MAG: response regulator [Candidatus Omnitrophota bacterium]
MFRKKILVVDDEPDILKTTRYILEGAGYQVYTAGSGEEGLELLEKNELDLVLLDLMLPGQSGFEIARKIKSIDSYKNIPIIVLSCKTEDTDKYIAVKSGVVEYIEKPINSDKLLFHVQDVLKP